MDVQVDCQKCQKAVELTLNNYKVYDLTTFVCTVCKNNELYKNFQAKEVEGAPAGFVKGTENPCKNNSDRRAFKG